MVKLRLKRMGAKKVPFYRIVAADSRAPRDGRDIETIGTYDPTKKPAIINIDEEKALNWLNKGAVPSDTVRSILSQNGIMKKFVEAKKNK
ncbi:MAG: 30S ribosomal protein S16 [Erysipelotrichaceae bacterium]|jgi:small subunit ribosomal protein S16|nr:30S ribosomal protein S16 [Erysipelotrichaceae bacterium]MCR5095708.1 30S ribosomal protein S16 [Erysipelotrichaceae bacterium]